MQILHRLWHLRLWRELQFTLSDHPVTIKNNNNYTIGWDMSRHLTKWESNKNPRCLRRHEQSHIIPFQSERRRGMKLLLWEALLMRKESQSGWRRSPSDHPWGEPALERRQTLSGCVPASPCFGRVLSLTPAPLLPLPPNDEPQHRKLSSSSFPSSSFSSSIEQTPHHKGEYICVFLWFLMLLLLFL